MGPGHDALLAGRCFVLSMLLVLDGCNEGKASIGLALDWARRFDGAVTAMGIVDEYAIAAPESASIGGDAYKERRDRQLLELGNHRVDEALAGFGARAVSAGVDFQIDKRVADRRNELLSAAQTHDLVLIARDTHFAGPDDQQSDGTLELLLSGCPRPVVAVPPTVAPGRGVLVGYSGGTRSAKALQDLVATGLHQLGTNWIVTVDRRSTDAARQQAERAAAFVNKHGGSTEVRPLVSRQSPGQLLAEEAGRLQVELLVLGSHSRSRIMSYLAGSVLQDALDRAACPVFLSS